MSEIARFELVECEGGGEFKGLDGLHSKHGMVLRYLPSGSCIIALHDADGDTIDIAKIDKPFLWLVKKRKG